MADSVLSKPKSDVFHTITEKIVAAIEAGAGPCVMPWHGSIVPPAFPQNAATGKPYRGVNVVALWAEAYVRRYVSGHWASYKQWQGLGGQVRKGERGAIIVFYKPLEEEEEDGLDLEEKDQQPRFIARASYVFNSEQVDGWQPPVPQIRSQVQIDEEVAAFIEAIGVNVQYGAHIACYRRDIDRIEMPDPASFIGTGTSSPVEAYHAVLCHECVHWSGAACRLDRDFGKRFGDQAYAFEELVAELGAAFLCSAFRIANEPRPDHAAYIASWLNLLNNDHKAIFKAASKAQEAVEYLTAIAAAHERVQTVP